ncbi:hypothetical protein SAMN06272735_8782 [Streptomyces sp. TLI_55]|nr:hypothetical protein SAMN06272735_8782 [Streptomyces sp. TLI_55]
MYRCLLDRGRAVPAEIANSLGVSETDVLRSASRLRELGLLHGSAGTSFQATNPEGVLLPLLARRKFEVESTLAAACTEIDRIAEHYRAGRLRSDPHRLIEVLSDRELIRERVDRLSNSATSHMWALDRATLHRQARR